MIVSMTQAREGAVMAKIKWLSSFAAAAALVTILSFFCPVIGNPPLVESMGTAGAAVASFGWTLTIDPMFLGSGMLMGTKTGAGPRLLSAPQASVASSCSNMNFN